MRKGIFRLFVASALTSAAVTVLAGTANAQQARSAAMTLGTAAPAPPGFLAFCARTPDQCGLADAKDARGLPLPPHALEAQLYASYYWSVAFGGRTAALATPAPSFGVSTTPTMTVSGFRSPSSGGAYNWNVIFGMGHITAPSPAHAGTPVATLVQGSAQARRTLKERPLEAKTPEPQAAAQTTARPSPIMSSLPAAFNLRAGAVNEGQYALASLTFAYSDHPDRLPDADRGNDLTLGSARQAWIGAPPASLLSAPRTVGSTGPSLSLRLAETSGKPAAANSAKVIELAAAAKATTGGALAARATPAQALAPAQPIATVTLEAPAGPVAPLAADHTLLARLDRVNRRINSAIRYVPDAALYGNEDYWHLSLYPGGPAAGDCKDYVLEKKRALIAEGIPAANLSIAIVQTSRGEIHAVLLVNTDRGELVLDSLSAWVQPWRKVGYRWLERQAPGQQLNWVAIS